VSGYLATYYDPQLPISVAATISEIEEAEIARIRRQAAVILVAISMPRRLGGEATDEDLALDKKRARRVLHVLKQCLNQWSKGHRLDDLIINDDIRREGAQLDWESWWDNHRSYLEMRLRYVATWSVQADQRRWGKTAVVRLNNETSWMRYALRD
jgi:hypothetical protein